MSEFEELISKLLDAKPELSRSQIEDQIKQKKEKIGAGYLTDQGALFLIASDLGVSLSEPLKVEMSFIFDYNECITKTRVWGRTDRKPSSLTEL